MPAPCQRGPLKCFGFFAHALTLSFAFFSFLSLSFALFFILFTATVGIFADMQSSPDSFWIFSPCFSVIFVLLQAVQNLCWLWHE